jgi:hypothetical protein
MHELGDRALARHDFHGEWNYTLLPVWRPAAPQPRPQRSPAAAARAALAPVVAALASPELTGLPRAEFAALAADLELPWAAAREQRLRLGAAAAPAGPAPARSSTPWKRCCWPPSTTTATACPTATSPPCSAPTTARHRPRRPGHHRPARDRPPPALAAGPDFLYTPDDLRTHAATAGITIPDPPHHASAPAHSPPRNPDTPETHLILEYPHTRVRSQFR